MSERDYVTLERRDGVAVVRLDRPKVNALSVKLLRELEVVLQQLAADPPGAVVVWGGDKVFAAGADIHELDSDVGRVEAPGAFRSTLDALAGLQRLTIAAVNGVALGGGCELALACDLRIAASDARFGQPEILLGIIPGGGATQRLARAVGAARAKELILTGRQIGAGEALEIGLVQRVVEPAAVLDTALELAGRIAAGPLLAQSFAKRAIDEGLDGPISAGLDLEQQLFEQVLASEDARIGLRSFIENGPGKVSFSGR